MRKILSLILSIVIAVGVCLSAPFAFETNAASVNELTFELYSDGQSYYVSDCSESASGVINIPSTYNGLPVTCIGGEAFWRCTSLISVTIPDSVTIIGNYAFESCTSLESITIPAGVTYLGYWAFYSCNSLRSITIPDSVTGIDSKAFYKSGYYNNSYNWENGVLYIDNHLIKAETSLSGGYVIKTGTKTIAINAFRDCTSLTSVSIPNSVTNIGSSAFNGCESLAYCYVYRDSYAYTYAVENNLKINAFLDPNSVDDLKFSLNSDGRTYSCNGFEEYEYTNLVIPSTYNGKPVTTISTAAFKGSALINITIPEGVTSIGIEAFNNCTSLTSVTIPSSVASIGSSAFYGCSKLSAVHVTDIALWCDIDFYDSYSNPLYYAKKLYLNGDLVKHLVIPDYVSQIKAYGFYNCTSLTSVTIPSSVTSIGSSAFYGCSNLSAVYITDLASWCYVDFYNSSANPLYYAKNLYLNGNLVKDLVIPGNVTQIKSYAFYNCTSLTSVTISNSLTSISSSAFSGCTNLKYKVYPNTYGYTYAVQNNLKNVLVLSTTSVDNLKFSLNADGETYNCDGFAKFEFTNIEIPSTYNGKPVTGISASAFKNCTFLVSIAIPDSVTSIGSDAFYNTGYYNDGSNWENDVLYIGNHLIKAKETLSEDYVIKSGTKCIADNAFYNCTSLTGITISNSITDIGSSAFKGCSILKAVYITDVANWCNMNFADVYANPLYYANNLYLKGELVKDLVIPTGVNNIKNYAFYNCSTLTSVTIPDSVTSIGSGAFTGVSNLKYKVYPNTYGYTYAVENNLTNVLVLATTSVDDLKFTLNADGETYTCNGFAKYEFTNLVIPSIYNDKTVTGISASAFENSTSLTSITIPDTVTSIGKNAFNNTGYYNESSNWKNDVIYIDNHLIKAKTSFSGDYEIKSNTKTIADEAFYNCTSLTSITILDTITSIGKNAFYNTDYYNNSENWVNDVLYIGNHLIKAKTSLAGDYEIKSDTKSIASNAFENCTNLISITIPDSVLNIGLSVFEGCSNLKYKVYPNTYGYNYVMENNLTNVLVLVTTSVDDLKFTLNADGETYTCEGFTKYEFTYLLIPSTYNGKQVTGISASAFENCTSLTSITIPDTVISIGKNAFNNTGYYNESSNWENDVLYIGNHLIKTKTTLAGDYEIKSGTKSIAANAFGDCTLLTSITIPDSVVNIGLSVFDGCSNLKYKVYPNSYGYTYSVENNLTNVLVLATTSVDDLKFTLNADGETYTCNGFAKFEFNNLVIPSIYNDKTVTGISASAFKNCYYLTSITIPDNITSIGSTAFYNTGYYNNTENWENNVLYIGNHLIKVKTSLAGEYEIKIGTKSIAGNAFENCTNLTSITIPDSIIGVGASAFLNCTSLENVYMSDISGWCNIAFGNPKANPLYYATNFYLNNSLVKNMIIPEGVTEIKPYAFYNYKLVVAIKIPKTLKIIGSDAFYNCTAISTVAVSDLSKWCNIQFENECSNPCNYSKGIYLNGKQVSELIIPKEVKALNAYAFYNCTMLTSVTIPSSVTSIGGSAFYGCSKLIAVYISDLASWCNIEFGNPKSNPLYYTKSLYLNGELVTEVVIPEGITEIKDYAFYNNTLIENVTIPNSVTSISEYAFYNCSALKYVFYTGSSTDWSNINICSDNSKLTSAKIHYNSTGHSHNVTKNLPFFEGMDGSIEDVCSVCGLVHYSEKLVYANDYFAGVENKFVSLDEQSGVITVDASLVQDINDVIVLSDGYQLGLAPSLETGFFGTGSVVNVFDSDWNFIRSYVLSVQGDVTGDSVCDVLDCMRVQLNVTGWISMGGAYLEASDFNGDGVLTDEDYQSIVNKAIA